MIFSINRCAREYSDLPYMMLWGDLYVYSDSPMNLHNFYGYRLSQRNGGNWWSIQFFKEKIQFERSVLSDYRWGYNKSADIVMTNHPLLIETYLNSLTTSVIVTDQGELKDLQIYRLKSSANRKSIKEVTDEIHQQLVDNTSTLIQENDCRFVSYSCGLDSSLNVMNCANRQIQILVTSKTKDTLHKYNCDYIDKLIVSDFYKHSPEFGTSENQVDKHFYDVKNVIDGSYGDLVTGHYNDIFNNLDSFQQQLIDKNLVYDQRPVSKQSEIINSFNKLKFKLVSIAISEPRRGMFTDYCVYDPYRDIQLLEILFQLSEHDLFYEIATAQIQKTLLAGSGIIITNYKNDLTSLYTA